MVPLNIRSSYVVKWINTLVRQRLHFHPNSLTRDRFSGLLQFHSFQDFRLWFFWLISLKAAHDWPSFAGNDIFPATIHQAEAEFGQNEPNLNLKTNPFATLTNTDRWRKWFIGIKMTNRDIWACRRDPQGRNVQSLEQLLHQLVTHSLTHCPKVSRIRANAQSALCSRIVEWSGKPANRINHLAYRS